MEESAATEKTYVSVAVPTPLDQLFTYTTLEQLEPGVRVKVPFGPRSVIGVVWEKNTTPEKTDIKFRGVKEVIDRQPVYTSTLLSLARWMSEYYLHPLGEVLRTMLPAGSRSNKKVTYHLTPKGEDFVSSNEEHSEIMRHCFGKRLKLTQVTLRKKLKTWPQEVGDLEKWFVNKGFIKKEMQRSVAARKSKEVAEVEVSNEKADIAIELTAEQRAVIDTIKETRDTATSPKPILLRGVTGSGKTEVYLQMIADFVEREQTSQVLMLVPEISLTPQMTRVFTARFPDQVAVVHSGLSENDRWQRLESIRRGEKRVLIGPRSAVFAAFNNLQLLIVDEEHDQSYKQATGLQYNGRDVAIVRAKLELATVVLGSATPSLESYHNARQGKYVLCEMNKRAAGGTLPDVDLIETSISKSAQILTSQNMAPTVDDVPIDDEIIEALRHNFSSGKQSIVIVNRRGYAYYLFDLNDKKPYLCPDCSVSLTVHGRNQFLKCHYCEYKTSMKKVLEDNPEKAFVVMGYGSQKAEAFLSSQIPEAKIVRLDSDTAIKKDLLPETLKSFRDQEIDILVGTQILAKGHDFPKVTLMAIIEVDKQLSLPDFRAGERSFQLLVQAAGRAGRAQDPGKVLVQTSKKNNPIIDMAMAQDYDHFAAHEIAFREKHEFPPFTRMIAVEYNCDNYDKLMKFDRAVENWLELYERQAPTVKNGLKIFGPLFPPIQTIRGRHRRQILFRDKDPKNLRVGVRHFKTAFEKLPGDIRMRVDVDPQTML